MTNYKSFASSPEETLKSFNEFYYSKFPPLFDWFYPNRKKNTVLFADRHFNSDRILHGVTSTERYFFSVAVFFHVLIPQVILRVAGRDVLILFLEASAWSRFYAGMAGPVGPEQWLSESEIVPSQFESKHYNALLEIILPFFHSELINFFSGSQISANKNSYENLCELVSSKTTAIIEELNKATRTAMKNFEQGTHPIYYLTDEEIKLYYDAM